MSYKKRILLVFDKKRKDLFSYLENDSCCEYYLLFYDRGVSEVTPPAFIKEEFFWSDFKTPQELLKKINPDKIIFQEVFDLKQIALNITAKKIGVETIFLDHGIWNTFESISATDKQLQATQRKEKLKRINKVAKIISGYFFYYASIRGVSFQNIGKFIRYPFVSFSKSLLAACQKIQFPERRPLKFILFSKYNFDTISSYYGCDLDDVTFTGFPFFDALAKRIEGKSEEKYIVFIDHPYLEEGILGWNENFHREIAQSIKKIADLSRKRVIVKLHPKSDACYWAKYSFLSPNVEFFQEQVTYDFYLNAELIIGYASTMMIGFICARKNVVVIGWHPQPAIFGIDFSIYKVCHKSFYPADVETCLNSWLQNNLADTNVHSLRAFTELFNSPFDGNASERITNLIST